MSYIKQVTMAAAKKKSNGEQYHVPNLDRALSILELLSRNPRGMIKNEIAEALSISPNSVYRITMTLINRGYLEHNDRTRKLRLTKKMMDLCVSAVDDQSIIDKAWDTMVELRDMTTETVHLETIIDHEGVVLEEVESLHSLRLTVDSGTRFELHVASPGKAMLAFMDEKKRDRILKKMKFTRFTENSITDRKKFQRELEQVRKQGYGVDRAECLPGIHCVSAPIIHPRDGVVAAITVSGPEARFPESSFKKYGKMVIKCAKIVSEKL